MKKVIRTRTFFLFLGDLLLYYLALIIAITFGFGNLPSSSLFLQHLFPFSIILPLWLFFIFLFNLYELEKLGDFSSVFLQTTFAVFLSIVFSAIVFYLFPFFLGITPKTNLLIFGVIFWLCLLFWRYLFVKIFRYRFVKKVLLIGKGKEVKNFYKSIQSNPHLGYQIVKFFDQWNPQTVKNLILEQKVNILIVEQNLRTSDIKNLLPLFFAKGVDVWDFAYAYEIIFKKIPVNHINYQWFLNNLKEGDKILTDKLKRVADIMLAVLFLIVFLPFGVLIALLIKLEDGGPIFYKQKRVGKNLKEFYIYKFRSMIPEAEKSIIMWTQKNDPRITKVGRIIRKMHFDEMPQMINILKGDISFVGPRPERLELAKELEEKIPFYNLRHIIRPGFTGWAQIKFGHARSIDDRFQKLEYDLYYIKNRSLFLDLYILFKTVSLLFRE